MGRFSEGAAESAHETGPLAELTSSAASSAIPRSPLTDSPDETEAGPTLSAFRRAFAALVAPPRPSITDSRPIEDDFARRSRGITAYMDRSDGVPSPLDNYRLLRRGRMWNIVTNGSNPHKRLKSGEGVRPLTYQTRLAEARQWEGLERGGNPGLNTTKVRQVSGDGGGRLVQDLLAEIAEDLKPRCDKESVSIERLRELHPYFDVTSLVKPVVKGIIAGVLVISEPAGRHWGLGLLGVYLSLDFAYQLGDRVMGYARGTTKPAATLFIDLAWPVAKPAFGHLRGLRGLMRWRRRR